MSDTNIDSKRIVTLPLNSIITDPALQMREALNEEALSDYCAAMKEGVAFPAVVVFQAGNGRHWLADGFHRVKAARQAGLTEIAAEVRLGERLDALLHAAAANSDHGLRRTNADKRKAVRAILGERELSADKSNREVARLCNVSEFLVRTVKDEEEGAINRTLEGQSDGAPPSPPATGGAPRAGRGLRIIKPPPGAGDAWEPPAPGSPEEQQDREVRHAAAVSRDLLGQELPRHLRDAFADSFYRDVVSSLRRAARHVNSDPCLYVRLHIKPADKPFARLMLEWSEKAQLILEHHAPHCICPDCGGKEQGCPSCFSSGWLSKGQHEERQANEA